jgi:hypothetical protein
MPPKLRQNQRHPRDWRSLSSWVRRTCLLVAVASSLALAGSSISGSAGTAVADRTGRDARSRLDESVGPVIGSVMALVSRTTAATSDRTAEVSGLLVLGLGLIAGGRMLARERARAERRQQLARQAGRSDAPLPLDARSRQSRSATG